MNRFVTTWMLWLLMLALPVQAQVTAIQTACGPSHQRSTMGFAGKTGPNTLAKSSHRFKNKATSVRKVHTSKSLKAVAAKVTHSDDHLVCSLGIICCGAFAALPNLGNSPAISDASVHHAALLPTSHLSYIPDGLERPPRLRGS